MLQNAIMYLSKVQIAAFKLCKLNVHGKWIITNLVEF